ncbi:MAG: hypothetical protein HQL54_13790 [Magnetococcales bacterium]|nr:hypothetical protein [Magnetococcales bacterium]
MERIFLHRSGENRELSTSDLCQLIRMGTVSGDELVWKAGWETWRPLKETTLFSHELQLDQQEDDASWANDQGSGPGFFLRHWRGDYSLFRSFWLHLVAVNVVLFGVGAAFIWLQPLFGVHIRLWLTLMIAGALLLIPISLWQLVGVWRADDHFEEESRKSPWGRIARASLVMMILWVVAMGTSSWPMFTIMLRELVQIDAPFQKWSVSYDTERKAIVVDGSLGLGLSASVAEMLDRYPDTEKMVLSSEGGWTMEGEALRQLILQRRHITTIQVDRFCASACLLPLTAAKNRVLGLGGQIGLHAPDTIANHAFTTLHAQNFYWDLLKEAGIKSWFLDQAREIGRKRTWIPHWKTLGRSGVITHRLIPDGQLLSIQPAELELPPDIHFPDTLPGGAPKTVEGGEHSVD